MDWGRVVIGGRARIRLPTGLADGEVVEVAGRVLGRARPPDELIRKAHVDPGWARVKLDDGTVLTVPQENIVEMLDSQVGPASGSSVERWKRRLRR